MANDPNDTNPVWSATDWDLGPCAACGPPFDTLDQTGNYKMYVHCGGTGATCVNTLTGATCSVGTAPVLGNFPGAIIDFLYWGDGAYGLSANGDAVWALGTAQTPVFNVGPFNGPPWSSLFSTGPNTIAVYGKAGNRFKTAAAIVNSVADHTCC